MSNFDKDLIEKGFLKFGEDGVSLAKRYCIITVDNETTQFVNYLVLKGAESGENLITVKPGMINQDGEPVSEFEADEVNAEIPQDYLSDLYFHRMSKGLLKSYVAGMGIAGMFVASGAAYMTKKLGKGYKFTLNQKMLAFCVVQIFGIRNSENKQ